MDDWFPRIFYEYMCIIFAHLYMNVQGLAKLLTIACDNTWNNASLNAVCEFLRMLLIIEDGLQKERLFEILAHSKHGLAVIAYHEK